jgi:hypothetical protein
MPESILVGLVVSVIVVAGIVGGIFQSMQPKPPEPKRTKVQGVADQLSIKFRRSASPVAVATSSPSISATPN